MHSQCHVELFWQASSIRAEGFLRFGLEFHGDKNKSVATPGFYRMKHPG
jgi:hypothetical protein